ncbi:MAG TPA: nuclear transport factor 2 family protein [Actinomycetales bacterium]|jgi:ketosteroid isomerase-like protein|nr:nuclear transport factor 2 family protein [Actinomycetales bacterium]
MTIPAEGGAAAVTTALEYFTAWTERDIDGALSHLAEEVVCEAPAGTIRGREAMRGFMGPFAETLTDAQLIAAFGDDDTALVMYDTSTRVVPRAPGAECHTVVNGQITHITMIFDRLPFEQARQAAAR